jgi:hypothetical protein
MLVTVCWSLKIIEHACDCHYCSNQSSFSLCFRVGSDSFLVRGYGVRSEISNNLTIGSYLNSIQVDLDLSFGVRVNTFNDIASFHVFLD